MSKPFDSLLNSIIDEHLQDWGDYLAARFGLPSGPVEALETDLSKTLQADRLFKVQAPKPYAIHLELSVNGRLGIPAELQRYNILAQEPAEAEVVSIIMLLRPKANSTDLTGVYTRGVAGHLGYQEFRYGVVKVWEERVESFLKPIGLAPLCILSNEAKGHEREVLEQMRERFDTQHASMALIKRLVNSAFILGGLRFPDEQLAKIFEDFVSILEESSTYQAIIRKGMKQGTELGKIEHAQQTLLRQGKKRFGPPTPEQESSVTAETSLERLELLLDAVLDASDWVDLLAR